MAHSLQFSDQFSCMISTKTVDSKIAWETVQILISWLELASSEAS